MLCLCCACGEQDTTPDTAPDTAPDKEDDMNEFDDITTYRITDMAGEGGLDFIIDFPTGKDISVMQITDTQMQTMAGVRNEKRKTQVGNAFFSTLPDDFEVRLWQYMDEAVNKQQPDLIVLTGDNVYGELDDSGEMWLALIEKMDSYRIPWCVVFGNHDNESGKGVRWQIEQLLKSEYCIFRQGNVTGNSNYNLLVRQGGKAKYLFYMMDSNGCKEKPNNIGEGMMPDNVDIDLIEQKQGFRDDQVNWMYDSAKGIRQAYGEVPVLMFFHIPPSDATSIVRDTYGATASSFPFMPSKNGDFGFAYETISGASCGRFWECAKEIGCEGIFVGHLHKIAASFNCEGIRLVFGLKAGTYDYHATKLLGPTLITLPEDGTSFGVEFVYSQLPYGQ